MSDARPLKEDDMKSVRPEFAVDLDRSAVARYIQLAGLFRRRIEAGDWAIGRQIPTVDDLTTECRVARATVRKALDMLEDEGLIERYRAKGTFVRERPRRELWCEVATDWSGLLAPRDDAVIEVLSDERGVRASGPPAPDWRACTIVPASHPAACAARRAVPAGAAPYRRTAERPHSEAETCGPRQRCG